MFENQKIVSTFISGSEEQLEKLTELALEVWHPYLLGRYDQCLIRYQSQEADPNCFVQLECSYVSNDVIESGPNNLERLCELIYSRNKFSGTHYQYERGPLDDVSSYKKKPNCTSYFFSRYVSPMPSPLEIASAWEELKDWLLSQDKNIKLADYLPPE